MMRLLRYFIVFSFALVALVVVILTFDNALLSNYLSGALVQAASNHGVILSIGSFSPLIIGLKMTALKAFISKSLLSISLDSVQTDCDFSPLLTGRASCSLEATLYNGNGRALIDAASTTGTARNILVNELNLSLHPQLAGLGIEQGIFSFYDGSLKWSNTLEEAQGTIKIKNLSKPSQTSLPSRLTGLPMSIFIPPISAELISSNLVFHDSKLELQAIEIRSTLGSVTGSISISAPPTGQKRISNVQLVSILTETGVEVLRPHLMFICENAIITAGAPLNIRSTGEGFGVSCTRN